MMTGFQYSSEQHPNLVGLDEDYAYYIYFKFGVHLPSSWLLEILYPGFQIMARCLSVFLSTIEFFYPAVVIAKLSAASPRKNTPMIPLV